MCFRHLLVCSVLVALAGSGCGPRPGIATDPEASAPLTAGFDSSELDTRIRPQDDLWNFVNGKWLASTPIPADQADYGSFRIVIERTEAQLRALLEEAATGRSPADTESGRIGALYRSFMDEAALETAGLRPLVPELAAISALNNHTDVIAFLGRALAAGIQGPVQWYVDGDADDPDRNLAYFWQDGLGLPDRSYFLDDRAELRAARAAYALHIAKLFDLAGWGDGSAAATTITGIEARLAKLHWSAVRNRDSAIIYRNKRTPAAADLESPGFDWPVFLAAAGFGEMPEFVVAQPDFFTGLGELIRAVPVADWQTYFRFKTLKRYAPWLNAAIVAENFDFEGRVLNGQEENTPRWRRGVRLVNSELGEALGKVYVDRHFPPESRRRMDAMIAELRAAFDESIGELTWMTPETRAAAREKLGKFRSKIGYPDRWRDYSSVEIVPDDLMGNLRRTGAFAHRFEVDKLGKPVDRDEWFMTPQTVNAYYNPTGNEIVFPAAILQVPFFDPAADDAYNYGSIGATIGHEFSHGFDDDGRRFDGDGRLRDWWTAADSEQYRARAERLVSQYNGFRPLPSFSVNGQLTLGENIADLAGLVIAWRAWQRSLDGQESAVIDGYTGAQRFFIGYALSFRGKSRPETLQVQLLRAPHPPDEYRVTGVVKNMDEFYAAFDVKLGDQLYLPPEKRVVIW